MKSTLFALLPALIAQQAAAHATFQQLWVDGEDQGSTCARLPLTNSPITSVTTNDIRCNAGTKAVTSKCSVAAGLNITVEMHQQPNDRSCSNEGIGGAHWGPIIVYMSKVEDASTADGSSGWFKIYEDGWKKNPSASQGDDDFWGTKTMNKNCGKVDLSIPADIASGDYLLRAEAIALHAAGSEGGAQPYVTCYQLSVTGGGSAQPETVEFPGAYSASDPGILVNIHAPLTGYTVPGPAVYSGGASGGGSGSGSGSGGNAPAVSEKAPAATSAAAAAPTNGSGSGSDGNASEDVPAATSAPANAAPTTFATIQRPATTAPAAVPTAVSGDDDDDSCDAESEEPVAAPTAAPSAGTGDDDNSCDAETEEPVPAPTPAPGAGSGSGSGSSGSGSGSGSGSSGSGSGSGSNSGDSGSNSEDDDSCDAETEAPVATPTAGSNDEDDGCDAEEPTAAPTAGAGGEDDECEA